MVPGSIDGNIDVKNGIKNMENIHRSGIGLPIAMVYPFPAWGKFIGPPAGGTGALPTPLIVT